MKKINKNLKEALKKRNINFLIKALREIESGNHPYTNEEIKIIKEENWKWEAFITYGSNTDIELEDQMDVALEKENYERAQIIKTEQDHRKKIK